MAPALMNQKINKPHFLAMPFPAQGHISPMLHLCKEIAAEGFTVSFVNVDSIHEQMKQHWVAPAGLDIRLESVPFEWFIPRGMDASCMAKANLPSFFDSLGSLGTALGELVERLSTEVSPVLGIISDYFLPFTQAVANKYGIPRIVLWSGCAKWSAIEFYVPELVAGGHVLPVKESDAIDWLPGLTQFRPTDIPFYLHLGDKRWKEITLERLPVIEEASWVLVNSFYDLEKETFDVLRKDLGQKFVPVGPIFLLDDSAKGPANVVLRPEDAECIQWLDSQAEGSVLYISFGSITVLSVEQFEELAQALESSKQPFLWVIRSELVTGGMSQASYRGFCERTKDQGFIVSWAPQLRVLEHPSVGGFLTHCGWNSMLESMCNGVPMLGWPWGAEQNWNCKHMVEDWKVGARISKGANGVVEKAEIERAMKLLMYEEEGKTMRKNARQIMYAGRNAVAEGGLSQKNLLECLKEIRSLAAFT